MLLNWGCVASIMLGHELVGYLLFYLLGLVMTRENQLRGRAGVSPANGCGKQRPYEFNAVLLDYTTLIVLGGETNGS